MYCHLEQKIWAISAYKQSGQEFKEVTNKSIGFFFLSDISRIFDPSFCDTLIYLAATELQSRMMY